MSPHSACRERRELAKNSARPLRDRLGERRARDRRSRGTALEAANSWPWKSIGVPRPEQEKCGERALAARADARVKALAGRRVRDLVVVLQEVTKRRRAKSSADEPRRAFCQE